MICCGVEKSTYKDAQCCWCCWLAGPLVRTMAARAVAADVDCADLWLATRLVIDQRNLLRAQRRASGIVSGMTIA
jgi:hypothetical protein